MKPGTPAPAPPRGALATAAPWLWTLAIVAAATLVARAMFQRFDFANLVMVYLLGIMLVAARFTRGAAVFASALSVAALDFFFVHPFYTFVVAELKYLVTFAVLFVVGLVMGTLTARLRERTAREGAALARAEREEARNALLSSVSHDLRTPLGAIAGAASALMEDPAAPEVRRDLAQTIYEESARLNRLVGNLLDMTRLESGLEVRREWTPVEEIVGPALERMNGALAGRPVDVRLAPDLPLVPVDAVLLQQALANLLDNAVKYTPPQSPLDIEAVAEAAGVTIRVSDRGPGLPPGSEDRVFDKFFRGAQGGGPTGSGLGLAIVRAVVRAHGGTITAEPRPGGGATFQFTLPLGAGPPAPKDSPGAGA